MQKSKKTRKKIKRFVRKWLKIIVIALLPDLLEALAKIIFDMLFK